MKVFIENKKSKEQREQNTANSQFEIRKHSEIAEALRELNKDDLEDNRMSGIDLRTRLMSWEITGILAVDTLITFRCLPLSCELFTRKKKRLNVSLAGEGRKEIVDISRPKEDVANKTGKSFLNYMGFGNNDKKI